jgi:hypothetical protein
MDVNNNCEFFPLHCPLLRIISFDAAIQTMQFFLTHPNNTLNQKIIYSGFEVVKTQRNKL